MAMDDTLRRWSDATIAERLAWYRRQEDERRLSLQARIRDEHRLSQPHASSPLAYVPGRDAWQT